MSRENRSVKEAREAVIEANGKIEDILIELFSEYGVITKEVDLLHVNHIRMFWATKVDLKVSI